MFTTEQIFTLNIVMMVGGIAVGAPGSCPFHGSPVKAVIQRLGYNDARVRTDWDVSDYLFDYLYREEGIRKL
jgi:hypothetical protein